MRQRTRFVNGIIHTGVTKEAVCSCMTVENGRIAELADAEEQLMPCRNRVDLEGKHVYPCLIDGHIHLLLTVAVMAMGFNICEITAEGVEPHTMEGIEARFRAYAARQKKDAVIACNNYILTAVDERRMPSKEELDDWGQGRPVIIYNIDGHSTALSSAMLRKIGIEPEGHSGVLQGEENERAQGRIMDVVGSLMTLPMLAKGAANFQNACAQYGIGIVGALEGNGDSEKDMTTWLISRLARHFDVGVRLYLQYTDLKRVEPYRHLLKRQRVGGCGDWEMDGASGSHSAAFREPYVDTAETAECYYSQEFVDELVQRADREGYQISSHAIGDAAIERLLHALEQTESGRLHRIEHCEFATAESRERIRRGNYAVMMQPGYAWIDKRYLHTYEQFLPESVRANMKFKSLYDAGICVCGSSDSPVQDMDPYLQMLGMVQFYHEEESITPYEAFRCYTAHAARALLEEEEYGTLEVGKVADFFTAEEDFFRLEPEKVVDFRPMQTYYGGKPYREKKGTVGELVRMMLTKGKKI